MASSVKIIDSWQQVGIVPRSNNFRSTCPNCSESRKNKKQKCLSIHGNVGHCHNCKTSYIISDSDRSRDYAKVSIDNSRFGERTAQYLEGRGISRDTAVLYGCYETDKGWLGFPQYYLGKIVNVKARNIEKKDFRLIPNAMLSFFGFNLIDGSETDIYITEGEIDALTIKEATGQAALSIPNGAKNIGFLDDVWDMIKHAENFHIFGDADADGVEFRDEISKRLGRDKCYYYEYPEDCKDVNDVLLKHGKEKVQEILSTPSQYPIRGILDTSHLIEDVYKQFLNGYPETYKTGHENFDKHFSTAKGQVTTVTGVPGHGKSEFVDEIVYRLFCNYNLTTFYISSEKPPKDHYRQVIEKVAKKKMHTFKGEQLMNENEFQDSYKKTNGYFFFYDPVQMEAKIDDIIEAAKQIQRRYGLDLVVIDPWNCLEDVRPSNVSETEWVSQVYAKLTKFAKLRDLHIFLIAHPKKMQTKEGQPDVPTLYDISGSAHFYNKTDNGITVYRNAGDGVEIFIQKIRFQEYVGKPSFKPCVFVYERNTRVYKENEVLTNTDFEF